MGEKEQPPGFVITNAIRAQRQSSGMPDRSNLSDTLVKSSEWKKNALQSIKTVQSGDPADGTPAVLHTLKQSLLELVERHWQELVSNADSISHERLKKQSCNPVDDNDDTAHREACVRQESKSMRKALAVHAAEVKDARRQLRKQSATLKRRSEEIERLQQTIVKLKAENARLTAEHQVELEAQKVELLELDDAYNQFQQQSDLLLNELDQQNELLRAECKLQNRRSIL